MTIVVSVHHHQGTLIFTPHTVPGDGFRQQLEAFLQDSGHTVHVGNAALQGFSVQAVTPTVPWHVADAFFTGIRTWAEDLSGEYAVQCENSQTPAGHKILRVSYQWVR